MSGAYDFISQIRLVLLDNRSNSAKHSSNSTCLDSYRLKSYLRSSSESMAYGVDLSDGWADVATTPYVVT